MNLVERILVKLGLVCQHCYYAYYTNPEFEAKRQAWLETSTSETILADFTAHLLPPYGGAIVSGIQRNEVKKTLNALKKKFDAHANSDNCWDAQSLESYLQTQIPRDEKYQPQLEDSESSLWRLVAYFSQWPFVTKLSAVSGSTGVTYPGFIRAITFLSGKHCSIFLDEYDFDLGTKRTDSLMREYIFRALAATQLAEKEPSWDPPRHGETARSSYHRDVLDIVYLSQPLYNEHTVKKGIEFIAPLADRLSTPEPPALSSLCIQTTEHLLPLIDLLISFLQHAKKFDEAECEFRIKDLTKAREEVENLKMVSFEDFMKVFPNDYIYDAIALIFSTFLHPDCLTTGVMAPDYFGERKTLSIFKLRR